ncbi:hypothetical protein B0A48_18380 [Cryoendolithus antarcticus]|uniref:Uncharacterized protein n=1 Tax=Cryoendolithus antarcticus TaxID=1507870 RepID=A0A1V8S8F8_9PEZI|nr:hypothetical protein B0A48_18380 [Cryoendolithus antarcticus]
MPFTNLIVASANFTNATSFAAGLHSFAVERNVVFGCLSTHWASLTAWLTQPHVLLLITVWWITFTVVITLFLCLGFGPGGVIAGSLAAGFQAWMYGAFTPAGGIFATMTMLGMLGMLVPAAAAAGAVVASIVTWAVWFVR